ncbi:MAG: hypothetical protein LUG51_00490 [Tannerellaceae bacterium]|nr:hypothetical protein [Tannerellaceae bacterium]
MTQQRSIQNRWSAWVLVILFMLPVMLKAFHQHEEPHCCHAVEDATPDSKEDSGDDCLICHFFYSSFTETETQDSVVYFLSFRLNLFLTFLRKHSMIRMPITSVALPPSHKYY